MIYETLQFSSPFIAPPASSPHIQLLWRWPIHLFIIYDVCTVHSLIRCFAQVCSAVQNQDFTIVQDYITGLKALLYTNGGGGRQERSRPTAALVKDTIDLSDDYDIVSTSSSVADQNGGTPKFGPYLRNRRRELATGAAADMVCAIEGTKPDRSDSTPVPAATVPEQEENADDPAATPVERAVGRSLKAVGAYKSLDNRAQVVALVNEVNIYLATEANTFRLFGQRHTQDV